MTTKGAWVGHLWTIRPWLAHVLRPVAPPPAIPWTTVLEDPRVGAVRLHGRLAVREGAREAIVIVHGLGGSIESQYVITTAREAARVGLTSLSLNLRGAPGDGEDLYNAGLTADLAAALASPELRSYETLYVVGYSLGGHLTLKHATEDLDPRVRAVAAICPPLDFDRAVAALDEPSRWIYRQNVLGGLKAGFAPVARRRPELKLPPESQVRAITKLREWDRLLVAPRFGYRSAEHYYAEASVGSRVREVKRPTLVVVATEDPMIPVETVRPALSGDAPLLDVRWVDDGGHVGFPPSFDLGLGGPLGLEPQVTRWLRRAASL